MRRLITKFKGAPPADETWLIAQLRKSALRAVMFLSEGTPDRNPYTRNLTTYHLASMLTFHDHDVVLPHPHRENLSCLVRMVLTGAADQLVTRRDWIVWELAQMGEFLAGQRFLDLLIKAQEALLAIHEAMAKGDGTTGAMTGRMAPVRDQPAACLCRPPKGEGTEPMTDQERAYAEYARAGYTHAEAQPYIDAGVPVQVAAYAATAEYGDLTPEQVLQQIPAEQLEQDRQALLDAAYDQLDQQIAADNADSLAASAGFDTWQDELYYQGRNEGIPQCDRTEPVQDQGPIEWAADDTDCDGS